MSPRTSAITLAAILGIALAGPDSAGAGSGDRAVAPGGTEIFFGGFESGNTLGWTDRQPPLIPPDVFRAADLDLRDPHVFLNVPGFGCQDFTDDPAGGGLVPSFNSQLAAAVTTDGDGDLLLDLSVLLGFRPLDVAAVGGRLDRGLGDCTAPLAGTICDWRLPPIPITAVYDGLAAGTCLAPHPGTTGGYLPAPAEPVAPCFTSSPQQVILELLGTALELVDSQAGGEFTGPPLPSIENGLLLGFLSEATADTILLPADIPIVGGQPISILLPGGTGNCAAGDDRDLHQGESGWWFYLDYRAEPVPFVGD